MMLHCDRLGLNKFLGFKLRSVSKLSQFVSLMAEFQRFCINSLSVYSTSKALFIFKSLLLYSSEIKEKLLL